MKSPILLLGSFSVTLGLCAAQSTPLDERVDRGPDNNDVRDCRIAASGETVYAVWDDRRNNSIAIGDIFVNVSHDGGKTWQVNDREISSNPAFDFDASDPQVIAEGDDVLVIWESTAGQIQCNTSWDRGETWLNWPRVVGTFGFGVANVRPQIASLGGGAVIAVWSSGGLGVVHACSSDFGLSWSTPVSVSSPVSTFNPFLHVDGGVIHLAWEDYRLSDGGEIYYSQSLDLGGTWSPEQRINTDVPQNALSIYPQIATSGASVHIAWVDLRDGTLPVSGPASIYVNSSTDLGATWGASDQRLDVGPNESGDSRFARITADGSTVSVLWDDGGPQDGVYVSSSTDGGATFSAPGLIWAAPYFVSELEIVRDGSFVAAVWGAPAVLTGKDVFFDYSLDAGLTWKGSVRLQDIDPGTQIAGEIDIAMAADDVYATWTDRRFAPTDQVWVTKAFGSTVRGTGSPGSGGLVPELTNQGSMIHGQNMNWRVEDGLGGASGSLLIGLGAPTQIAVPVFGGELLVQPTVTLPMDLGGASGGVGAGTATLPLLIPNDSGLMGLNANFQALFLDPGATGGVVFTNAVDTWIG